MPTTHQLLSYAGVRCSVLGTFYVGESGDGRPSTSSPSARTLATTTPTRAQGLQARAARRWPRSPTTAIPSDTTRCDDPLVPVGAVRYASTNRPFQNASGRAGGDQPADLLGQKTALFGMTRTGKSNTTKIILKVDVRTPLGIHRQTACRPDRLRPQRRVRQREPAGQGPGPQSERDQERLAHAVRGAARDPGGRGHLRHRAAPQRPRPSADAAELLHATETCRSESRSSMQRSPADSAKYISNFRDVTLERA